MEKGRWAVFFLLPLFYWQGEPIVILEEVWCYMADVHSCLHLTGTPSAWILLLHDALTLKNADQIHNLRHTLQQRRSFQ